MITLPRTGNGRGGCYTGEVYLGHFDLVVFYPSDVLKRIQAQADLPNLVYLRHSESDVTLTPSTTSDPIRLSTQRATLTPTILVFL